MKLFFTLFLFSTIVVNELPGFLEIHNGDSCPIEKTYDGELEKEVSESLEDVEEVKFDNKINIDFLDEFKSQNESSERWLITTPYLEIHSPPPDPSL